VFVHKATTFRNIFSYVSDIMSQQLTFCEVLHSLWNRWYLSQPSLRVLGSRTGVCYACV